MKTTLPKINFRPFLLSISWLLFGGGCATVLTMQPPVEGNYWNDDSLGSPSIRINLTEQKAYFYRSTRLVGVSLISTGREGLETITGSFQITEKDRYHASSLYGNYVSGDGTILKSDVNTRRDKKPPGASYVGAPMPYWMRIVGGTGMHYGNLPGYPASHGCIRMPKHMAAAFFNAVEVGTPVSIEP